MSSRRTFLKNLGLAVAGAAVASKIELLEQIIPIPVSPLEAVFASYEAAPITAGPITFSMLAKAYQKACIGSAEPSLMIVSRKHYAQVMSFMEPQYRFVDEEIEDELGLSTFKFFHSSVTYGDLEIPARPELIKYGFKLDSECPVLVGVKREVMNYQPKYQEFYANFS